MSSDVQRKLAAIVSADVVGYSRLMGVDETGTLAALRAHRAELVDDLIARHGGRIVKTMGDGLLIEFSSVVDATKSMLEIQRGMAARNQGVEIDRRITFRIGVNIGDIIVEDGDIFGDGVNIAARLQEISAPGGVAVSGRVHDDIRDRLDIAFDDAGEVELKNIARKLRVWRWSPDGAAPASVAPKGGAPAPSDKPSIAVLPFTNMSGDPEQEFFVDGMVEDILTTLSKIPLLLVIARNSSFRYKGMTPDLREVGRDLGVRYAVEGSVRKAGNRVRVTAQLIDCADGKHIWADRYDGELDDVFDLQDRITREIVIQLEVNLSEGEQTRIWRQRSGSPLVYDAFLKGRSEYIKFTRHTHAIALHSFNDALAINPDFTPAKTLISFILTDQTRFGWATDPAVSYDAAVTLAEDALESEPETGELYSAICYARTYQRRHDEAVAAAELAIRLSPNEANVHHMAAMTHIYAGNYRTGMELELQYSRLSPIDLSATEVELARARYHLGMFSDAVEAASAAMRGRPRWMTAHTILIAALHRMGRVDEARKAGAALIDLYPKFSVGRFAKALPYRNADDLADLMAPLREIGLPD